MATDEGVRFVRVSRREQIASVASLAREIWDEYYVPLIGEAQVDYMVARFQSEAAIQQQIREDYEYFLVHRGQNDVGYLAVQEDAPSRRMFISKLYLTKGARGTGTGRACMEFIEHSARGRGLSALWLTVNKGNPSVAVYERLGFRISDAIVMDIGGGFVMDDFRMERELT
jgi:diamine N-acetyltransferase